MKRSDGATRLLHEFECWLLEGLAWLPAATEPIVFFGFVPAIKDRALVAAKNASSETDPAVRAAARGHLSGLPRTAHVRAHRGV